MEPEMRSSMQHPRAIALWRERNADAMQRLIAAVHKDDLAKVLAALAHMIKDVDVSISFGHAGGHALLSRWVATSDADASAAAAECVAACVGSLPAPFGFPMHKAVGDGHMPGPLLRMALRVHDSATCPDSRSSRSASPVSPGDADVTLYRRIPAEVHRMESQDDVGQVLWPAAPVLARFLLQHASWFTDTDVLEIGAGMGVSGIALGAFIAAQRPGATGRFLLTDFKEHVLANARYNAQLNEPARDSDAAVLVFHTALHDWSDYTCECSTPPSPGCVTPLTHSCVCAHFRRTLLPPVHDGMDAAEVEAFWSAAACTSATSYNSRLARLPRRLQFHRIIGSDMICCDADAVGVAATLAAHLSPAGFAVLLVAPPDARWGVAALDAALEEHGLFAVKSVVPPSCLAAPEDVADIAVDGVLGPSVDAHVTAGGYEARLQLYVVTRARV